VIFLLGAAIVFGFVGWFINPDITAGPSVPSPGFIYIVARHGHVFRNSIKASASLLLSPSIGNTDSQPTNDNVELDYLIRGDGLPGAGSWYVVAALPPGGQLVNAFRVTMVPLPRPALCKISGLCPAPEAGAVFYKFTPEGNEVGINLHWNQRPSGLISIQGYHMTLTLPWILLISEGTLFAGNFAVPYGLAQLNADSDVGPKGDYVIDDGTPPTSQDYATWNWHSTAKDAAGNVIEPIIINSAHSLSGDDAAHRNEFISGVLLGLAGAAAIAGIQEFLNRVQKSTPKPEHQDIKRGQGSL
jgi:hypothetical protein